MLSNDTRKKIKNITTRIIIAGRQDTCTTIRNLLSASFITSTTVKTDFESKSIIKEEQTLLQYNCLAIFPNLNSILYTYSSIIQPIPTKQYEDSCVARAGLRYPGFYRFPQMRSRNFYSNR